MNLSWRTRRQLGYLAIPIVPTLLIGGYLIFKHYTTSSCNDGRLNQGELGIDCEGPCPRICQARITQPEILWSRAFQVQPGIYNLAAMISNRNDDLIIDGAAVQFRAVDESGVVVYEGDTTINMRPATEAVAFIGPVQIDPAPTELLVTFNLTETNWRMDSSVDLVSDPLVLSKQIVGSKTEPEVESEIQNTSRDEIGRMPVAVLILDENNQAVAVSNTFVDLDPQETKTITYTWPRAFPTTTGVCQQPVDVVLMIDGSGSMNSISTDPPEPLTSVKLAAGQFARLFSSQDQVGVVSFANQATVTQPLTTDVSTRISGVDSVIITSEAEDGYTNVASALSAAFSQLQSARQVGRGRAAVLLTDGLPTAPSGEPDPSVQAVAAANQLQASGIELFVIGLGDRVNNQFLRDLVAGDSAKVFKTTNVDELATIYSQIASAVCERSPYGVEVYPNPPLPENT